jgi:tetratricopeptide (TPR) repeat protein
LLSLGDISADAVAAQLARVTASQTFENAPVLRHLLEYLVTRTISGNTDQLKEYSVGVDVFGRGASFDPRVDTIVRVQARRLRAKLTDYYDDEGQKDPVIIELPKGRYIPNFRHSLTAAGVDASDDTSVDRSPGRRRIGLAAGLLVGLGLLVVLLTSFKPIASRHEPRESAVLPVPAADAPRRQPLGVVVTPFENHTGDVSLDTIGQRVAERVIASISTIEGAAVTARSITKSPGDKAPADLLVAGTYYRDGDTLEFQTRLVDARTGRLLYGFTTVAPQKLDTATLESLRQRIAGAIAVHQDDFFGGLDAISHPPTLDAYREYRAGLETFQSDFARALSHLQRSRELTPHFIPAMAVMMFAYGNLGQRDKSDVIVAEMEGIADRLTSAERLLLEFLQSNRNGRREQARGVLEQLERLVPASLLVNFNLVQSNIITNRPHAAGIAYTHIPFVSKAFRHSVESYRRLRFLDALHMIGDYQRELDESRRAQADDSGVLLYVQAEARALIALGRRRELQGIVERSQSLSRTAGWSETPGDLMELCAHELRAHDSREGSLAMAARAVEWYRGRPAPSWTSREHREGLARVLYLVETWHDAAALFEGLARDYPNDMDYRGWQAFTSVHTGDLNRARVLSSELEQASRPEHRGWLTYARARVAAALGERDRALHLLRDAFAEGLEHGPHLHQTPDFEILRGYEPYQRLLRPAG